LIEGVNMSMGPLGGGWYQPQGRYGPYPGCGCSSVLMVIAGIILVFAGMLRGCNM
jgi:hypothetical protein